jgi:hypothetical protein
MQCVKLVNGGFVDKVIVFDELPERLIKNIQTREVSGFPRSWAKWLISIGSVRDVVRTETTLTPDSTYKHSDGRFYFRYTPIGKEPCFYVLQYTDVNADKETWRAIGEYLRMNVGPSVRLKEKIEDMAIALAPDSKTAIDIEPEEIPVIPVPNESVAPEKELVEHGEQILVEEHKKRGRPKKVAVGA